MCSCVGLGGGSKCLLNCGWPMCLMKTNGIVSRLEVPEHGASFGEREVSYKRRAVHIYQIRWLSDESDVDCVMCCALLSIFTFYV